MTENFLVVMALSGGMLIGLASVLMLLMNGRITGISGIVGGLLQKWDNNELWRLAFVIGIPVGAGLLMWTRGEALSVETDASVWQLIVAGLLVGFGTRLGSGCTSGHGVCGLARLSPRSLLATLIFMVVAMLTVYVTRHWLGGGI